MVAAVSAKEENPHCTVIILEKKEKLGKKLSATGNGKCNLSNSKCANVQTAVDFFYKLGILTREDGEGRLYPYTEQAKDVVYALESKLKEIGIQRKTGCTVEAIYKGKNGFHIESNQGSFAAKTVLLAAGGKAAPQLGTTGDGYRLAQSMGHRIVRLAPVLTPIQCYGNFKQLKGLRVKGAVSLLKEQEIIFSESGEIQFTEDGLSGICIFNLSRFVKTEEGEAFAEALKRYEIVIDFMPDWSDAQIVVILEERQETFHPSDLLLSIVPQPLAAMLLEHVQAVETIAQKLKSCKFLISGVKGWKNAQCTSGGVALNEITEETMESKLVRNLYFAGEILDYDGPCGGFNLQNAWETAIKAGKAMACTESIK